MFTEFNIDRCIEASGVLFLTTKYNMMGRMRLLKLLYISNRVSLKETGDPVVDDNIFAMKDGPVLSCVYDLIKGTHRNSDFQSKWNQHFIVVDKIQVQMICDPGTGHLSDYDVGVLEEQANRHQSMEDYELSAITHSFLEWRRVWDAGANSRRIQERDLLEGIGYSLDEADIIIKESKKYAGKLNATGCQ